MPGHRPIYFSVDWDAGSGDWAAIDAALKGAASVIGAGRVGIYGGYNTIAHCASAGTAAWFWQTYAWSTWTNPATGEHEVRWHPRCHLQQYKNGVSLADGTVDLTRAVQADYGQWGGTTVAWNPPRGSKPDYTLLPDSQTHSWLLTTKITRAHRWFVERLLAMEPGTQLGGTYTDKPGYHNMRRNLPSDDYSVRDAVDKQGPDNKCGATDWTFPTAQAGNYTLMVKYGKRMRASYDDRNDPRLNGWREALGQFDIDAPPEAIDFRGRYDRVPDDTHKWHWHYSETRANVESFDNKWALLTVLLGWTTAEWRQSISEGDMPLDATDIAKIKALLTTDADVKSVLIARPWQYAGGGLPTGVSGTLGAFTEAINTARALRTDMGSLKGQVGALGTSMADAITKAAAAAETIPQATVDRLKLATATPEQKAELLRAILGEDAAAVGRILAGQ
jgi:hypothetical protein